MTIKRMMGHGCLQSAKPSQDKVKNNAHPPGDLWDMMTLYKSGTTTTLHCPKRFE